MRTLTAFSILNLANAANADIDIVTSCLQVNACNCLQPVQSYGLDGHKVMQCGHADAVFTPVQHM